MAAVLVAVSPPMLFQVVQPMNDVATAALWMATFVALLKRRWALAGVSCGLALLVRPNLLPLALIAGLFIAVRERRILPFARFAFAAIPSGLLVLWLNSGLYGSPFRTGYGQLGHLFGLAAVGGNAPRYFLWLVQTHTPFPLLGLAAPFIVPPEKRGEAWLAAGLILSTCLVYFIYTPFDDWSYLRFLLPAITAHARPGLCCDSDASAARAGRRPDCDRDGHCGRPRHFLRAHGAKIGSHSI